jgi:hypothetical protein
MNGAETSGYESKPDVSAALNMTIVGAERHMKTGAERHDGDGSSENY